jgi:putative ABC transport system substrate-binding protein
MVCSGSSWIGSPSVKYVHHNQDDRYIVELKTDAPGTQNQKRLAEACQRKAPSRGDFAESGGLLSYGAEQAEPFRRAAVLVDKILKGAKPADLPVEQPKKFELVINLKATKQIGLTIPPNVLARANRVIR